MTQLEPTMVRVDFASRREAIERELSTLIAERRAEAARLYRIGHSLHEVAAHLGISSECVRQDLRVSGVTLRPANYPEGMPRQVPEVVAPSVNRAACRVVDDAFRPRCCTRPMLPVGDPKVTHWHCLKCGENRRVR